MDEDALTIRGRGRPPGAKNKPKASTPERLRLRDAVARAYSQEQLEKILKRLSPDQAARLLAALEPRMKEEQGPSVFKLIVRGIPGAVCPQCGFKEPEKYVDPEETEGDEEKPDSSASEQARAAHRPYPPDGRKKDKPDDGETTN